MLYVFTDGPAEQLAENPPNWDGSGDANWTVSEMTVWVYWRPGLTIWLLFSSDPDPDPKWQSRAVAHNDSGELDTWVTKGFGIFSETTMLQSLQSIAQENRCQLLDSPESDAVLYLYNHPWIDTLCKWYSGNVSYPVTWLMYSSLTWTIQPCISSLRNQVQVHLRSTLLSSVMVSDLTPHS
jgi:hypothetical protein